MSSSTTLTFLGRFVRNPRQVGAVVPSSPALARAMVRGLDVAADRSVVELGPGTGALTQTILRHLTRPDRYLGIELNRRFVEHLRRRFPGAPFVHGCAQDADRHHAETDLPTVGAVLCGLPFASLDDDVQDGVVDSLARLLPAQGQFRTFQYVHAYRLPAARRFRRRMDRSSARANAAPRSASTSPPPTS